MSLAQYRKRFSRLRTYKDRKKWSAITAFQAPHKPFLLLSIMDLIVQGSITENFIEPGFELVETFNGYWNSIMPLGSKTSMSYPFPRLKTDGFWPEQDNLHWHRKNLFRRWWKRVSYGKLLTFELVSQGSWACRPHFWEGVSISTSIRSISCKCRNPYVMLILAMLS